MPTHPGLDTVEDEAEDNNCSNEDSNNHTNIGRRITVYKGVTTGLIPHIECNRKGKGEYEETVVVFHST